MSDTVATISADLSHRLDLAVQHAVVPEQQTLIGMLQREARAGQQYTDFSQLPADIQGLVLHMEARQ